MIVVLAAALVQQFLHHAVSSPPVAEIMAKACRKLCGVASYLMLTVVTARLKAR